ncbi:hypothetical protein C8F01DRAFT_1157206 [Mycena amicta]|nr:hypothetical protein C8F01DRAFT_1157206 [Mycena amicta]
MHPSILTLAVVFLYCGCVEAATSTPIFAWSEIPEMYTCQSATVTWLYEPADSAQMVISVTNFGVAQAPAPSTTTTATFTTHSVPRRRAIRAAFAVPISGLISTSAQTFTWPTVNISAGWYDLAAIFPATGAIQESSAFFVDTGADTSCLDEIQPADGPLSSTIGSLTAVPFPTVTSSVTNPPPASSSTGNTSPSTPTSHIQLGGIIGGVACGVAAVLIAGILLRCSRRRPKPTQNRYRNWVSSGFSSAKLALQAADANPNLSDSQSSSFGPRIPRSSSDANLVDESVLRRYIRKWSRNTTNASPSIALSLFSDPPRGPFDTPAASQRLPSSTASYRTYSSDQAPVSNRESSSASSPSPAYPSGASFTLLDVEAALGGDYNANDPVLSATSPPMNPFVV